MPRIDDALVIKPQIKGWTITFNLKALTGGQVDAARQQVGRMTGVTLLSRPKPKTKAKSKKDAPKSKVLKCEVRAGTSSPHRESFMIERARVIREAATKALGMTVENTAHPQRSYVPPQRIASQYS